MRKAALAVAGLAAISLGVFLLAPRGVDSSQGGALRPHSHSSAGQGGTTLSPLFFTVSSLGQSQFNSKVKVSSVAFTVDGLAGNIVARSSITTSGGFFGNGLGLTDLNPGGSVVVTNQASGYQALNTTFGPCLAGSTVAWVSAGAYVNFKWTAGFAGFNYAETACVGVLVDGAFIDNESVNEGLACAKAGYASDASSIMYLNYTSVNKISAESHQACLTWASASGSGTRVPTVLPNAGANWTRTVFRVKDEK